MRPTTPSRNPSLALLATLLFTLVALPLAASAQPRQTAQAPATAPLPNAPIAAAAETLPPGVYRVGGDVKPPVLRYQVDPDFPERARKARISGNVEVAFILSAAGLPQQIRLVRGLGYDLDEAAIQAVQQYRYSPATRNGSPVPVALTTKVNFQIF